jgi:hypothetical protein
MIHSQVMGKRGLLRCSVRNQTPQNEFFTDMDQMTYRSSKTAQAAEQLRIQQLGIRGKRLLELATRAYCEQHYDFARLLTQLATEVFARAKETEESYTLCRYPVRSRLPGARRR